jgi:hypothetical protein
LSDPGQPELFVFNTIANNIGMGIDCQNTLIPIYASLVVGNSPDFHTCTPVWTDTTANEYTPGNPLFAPPPSPPYRLTINSPCVDVISDPTVLPIVPDHDIDGNPRPQGKYFDCGASEHMP